MSPLHKYKPLYEEELKAVDARIIALGEGRPDLIKSLLSHIVTAGGKRLRPIILILCAKMLGGKSKLISEMAACVELLHTATLFHDDVVDGSKMRRGRKTANELWGNPASVLVGDFLLAQAFGMMSDSGSLEIIKVLSHTSSILTEGEIKQLMHKADIKTSIEDYIDIITAKTAELFAACGRVGAIIADADEEQKTNAGKFGRNLGISFQISDDELDYFADENSWGKKLGDDFREGKATLPVIHLYKVISSQKSAVAEMEKLFSGNEELRNEEEFRKLRSLMIESNSQEFCRKTAIEYCDAGKKNLSNLPENEYSKALEDILKFSIEREG